MKIFSIVIFFAVFLTSCGAWVKDIDNTSSAVSGTGKNIESQASSQNNATDIEGIVSMLPDILKNKEEFKWCVKNNIDMCLTEQAQLSPEEVSCEDYLVESNRVLCDEQKKISKAKETKDVSVCASLSQNKESCEYEVILSKGLENADVDVCETLSEGYKTSCNNEIIKAQALKQQDLSLCKKIIPYVEGDTFEQKFCEDEVKFQIEEAKRIEEEEKAQKALEKQMQEDLNNQVDSWTGEIQ